jgi:hypothetical protein
MVRSRRLLATAAVLAAAPTLMVVAVAGPAGATSPPAPAARVTCSGDGCTGQRPELTGCDKDGRTIRTGKVVDASGRAVGTIELRWSPTCGTNWARVSSTVGAAALSATVTRSDSKAVASGFKGTQTWSPMVFARANAATATGWINKASGAIADGAPSGEHYN